VEEDGKLVGVVTRSDLLKDWVAASLGSPAAQLPARQLIIAFDLIYREPITADPGESCRVAAERMVQTNVDRLPVVSPDGSRRVIGIVTLSDLLKSRAHLLEEEMKRERFIRLRWPRWRRRQRKAKDALAGRAAVTPRQFHL
jgi:CBS-domain-containing membrane protein